MKTKNSSYDSDWVRFQKTALSGATLMHAHFAEHSFEMHSHETFSIGLTHAGIQAFRCRGEDMSSVKGKIIAFNPDQAHDGHRGGSDAFEYSMLYIEPDVVFDLLKEFFPNKRMCYAARPLIDDPSTWRALHAAISALQHPAESLRSHNLMVSALVQLFSRHGDTRGWDDRRVKVPSWISRARDYIEQNYVSDITVDDLARTVQVSRVHVTRAFAATYGVSPHVYLNSVRIGNAKRLLLLGRCAADVAAESGFADQSHFTRRFKGSVGMTPLAWVKEMQRCRGGSGKEMSLQGHK